MPANPLPTLSRLTFDAHGDRLDNLHEIVGSSRTATTGPEPIPTA